MKIKSLFLVTYVFTLGMFFQTEAHATLNNTNSIVVQADKKCPCNCGENPCRCPHCPKK